MDKSSKDNTKSLHSAARHNDSETIKKMIAAGADLNERDNNGSTPLILAAMNGHLEIVELLLHLGADKNLKDNSGYNAYYSAMFHGDFKGMTLEPYKSILELLK